MRKKEKIDLLGITISKCNPYSLEYIDAYCRFNDKYDIPLGYAYNGMNTDDGHYLRQTLDTIIDNNKILHPKRSLKDHILEGYKLLRKIAGRARRSFCGIYSLRPGNKSSPFAYLGSR